MKITNLILFSVLLASCTALDPRSTETIVAGWDDWRLCQRLADYTYKGKAKWLWSVTSEIKNRKLEESQKCKMIYDSRLAAHVRNNKSSDIQITFGQAIDGKNPSFDKVTE